MKIVLIVEGKTEKAFIPYLRSYLRGKLPLMPSLDPHPYDGRIPTGEKLRRIVQRLLSDRGRPVDHVIALTDVYTGSNPPDFADASDAKVKMRQWVGDEPRFHPHAAQFDFEAWLLPYWNSITRLAGHSVRAPRGNPELVDQDRPPARRIKEVFRNGTCRTDYVKPRDAARILRENDLSVAVNQCRELKALVNTTVLACGGVPVP